MDAARPTFFIVGAPKSGTTSMNDYLGQHPEIFMARKEPHFFGSDLHFQTPRCSPGEYAALFEAAGGAKRVGESSVYYLVSKRAASEIRDFAPDAKIIIMIRNPADLVVSLFHHNRFRLFEDVDDFGRSLGLEGARRGGKSIPRGVDIVENLFYREVVRFPEQVGRYLEIFGRENVHTIIFDDFQRDPRAAYAACCRFLGVRADFVPEFRLLNPAREFRSRALQSIIRSPDKPALLKRLVPRSVRRRVAALNSRRAGGPPVDPGVVAGLRREFAPGVRDLGRLLGRDLSSWGGG